MSDSAAAPRYRFYEEVRIAAPRPENAALAGELGVLLGLGDVPGQPLSYGVYLYNSERVVCFAEEELAATGRQFTREEFYRRDRA